MTDLANAEVGRSEVVRPLGHAVGLVDADEGDGRQLAQEPGQSVRSGRSDRLGRDEQHVNAARLQRLHALLLHRFALVRVQAHAAHELGQVGHLAATTRDNNLNNQL